MGEVVNLNRARKARAAGARRAQAAANRVAHGRTKAEKDAARAEEKRREDLLDGARRED